MDNKKKAILAAIAVIALIIGTVFTVFINKGSADENEEIKSDSTSKVSSTKKAKKAEPTVAPLKLEAKAVGGENKAEFTVTANRNVSGELVIMRGDKILKTQQFTTSEKKNSFKTTVKVNKLEAGKLVWEITVPTEKNFEPVSGKINITKPAPKKDVCANGDYTGDSYDGKCGTKPAPKKDYCPSGDYTGNSYDGKCGSKPAPAPKKEVKKPAPKAKDHCPNGDYTGSRYDGRCGSKPKPPSTGGGKDQGGPTSCPPGYSLVTPDHGPRVCWNNVQQ